MWLRLLFHTPGPVFDVPAYQKLPNSTYVLWPARGGRPADRAMSEVREVEPPVSVTSVRLSGS